MSDDRQMLEAVALIESELGADVSWNLGIVTSEMHMAFPYGRGVTVSLQSKPGTLVWEKHKTSFLAAAEIAIDRYRRRAAGEKGA
jgi:hypothetical protein